MEPDPLQPPTLVLPMGGILPRNFGRYVLRERLGSGGMGAVYLAHDTLLQVDVALKMPHPDLMAHPDHRERFYHEARAAARLDHPHFARVCDVGEHAGVPYLTMRYIPGRPLNRCPPTDPGAVIALVHTLARALAHAHRLGVIHRDLKPSNILLTSEGTPVITDFGLALRLDSPDNRLTRPGTVLGTPEYMPPEQVLPNVGPIGPASDVYSLGVILYELLTGRVPFQASGTIILLEQILHKDPPLPSTYVPDLDRGLEAICIRALAKRPEERFANMDQFAEALADYLGGLNQSPASSLSRTLPLTTSWPVSGPVTGPRPGPPRVRPECIRFAFAGYGERAPGPGAPQDRLFLDVGNDLRPGVIDHHHQSNASGSTASLVLHRPDLVLGAVAAGRRPDDPFTIVLHEQPDLDGVASAYLARECLTTGRFPEGAEVLARYVDKVDDGSLGMTLANPFGLYAAHQQLTNRLLRSTWNSNYERWRESVRLGLEVVGFVLTAVVREATALPAVDAFACPGVFGPEDRQEVLADIERYQRKLSDPRSRARRTRLRLPGEFGGKVEAEALLVRDVQNPDDPERCVFFKDWARSDAERCPGGRGFVALSVFISEGPRQVRRCILSVKPDSGATLEGLGDLLDQAESERRRDVYGVDDRVTDPTTGAARSPRAGYANADPWYDGRAQGYTIVDAPRSGTLLTADEIETLFLQFGGSTPTHVQALA